MISILEELRHIKSSRKELREFGITIGIVLLLLAGLGFWRGRPLAVYFLIFGGLFIGFGLIAPAPLKPLQKAWMGFAVVMGFVMSRVILTALFFGVLTPITSVMKLLGKDILDERIVKVQSSYWRERAAIVKHRESYENQY